MANEGLLRQAYKGLAAPAVNVSDTSVHRGPPAGNEGWRHRGGNGVTDPAVKAGKASQLFQALRAGNPEIDEEELMQGADYHERQRKFLQDRNEQKVLERLERRADTGATTAAYGGQRRSGELVRGAAQTPLEQIYRTDSQRNRRSIERKSLERRSLERSSLDRGRSSQEYQRKQQRTSQEHKRNSVDEQGAGAQPRPATEAADCSADEWKATVHHHTVLQPLRGVQEGPGGLPVLPVPAEMAESMERPGPPVTAGEQMPTEQPAPAAQPVLAAQPEQAVQPGPAAQSEPGGQVGAVGRPPSNTGPWVAAAGTATPTSLSPPPGAPRQPPPRFVHPRMQAAYDASVAPQLLSSLTEDDLFAATSALAAVQNARTAPTVEPRPEPAAGVESRETGTQPPAVLLPPDAGAARSPSDGHPDWPPPESQSTSVPLRGSGGITSAEIGYSADEANTVVAPGLPRRRRADPGPQQSVLPPSDDDFRAADPAPAYGKGAEAGRPGSPAQMAEALGLVEVAPLSDHFQREDNAPADPAMAASGGDRGNNQRTGTSDTLGTYDEYGELAQYSRARQWAIRVCSNPDFEMVVTAIIFANCVTLCLFNPRELETEGLNRKLFWAELAFNICFSIEMLLRVVAMGSPWAYIRRPWNQFDLFMVVAGYTVFVPGNSSAVNAIRALRALRPLRTITRFESLRGVIVCFLEALPLLASVGGLLIFFIFLYAVAAVQLFPKTYHWTCLDANGIPIIAGEDPDMFGCGGSGHCPVDYTCELLDKQYTVNVAGFDNTGLAMLSVWQALTLTGWVFMMYRTVDAYSLAAVAYYLTLVFIGAYFVLNLFLAVLKIKFAKAQTLFHNQVVLQRSKARRNSIMTLMGKVQSKWTQYSSTRSQASLLNSKLSSAISSRMGSQASLPSPRMSGAQIRDSDLNQSGSKDGDERKRYSGKVDDAAVGHGNSWGSTQGVVPPGSQGAAADGLDRLASSGSAKGGQGRSGREPEHGRAEKQTDDEQELASGRAHPVRMPSRSALANPRPSTPKGGRSMRATRAVSFHRHGSEPLLSADFVAEDSDSAQDPPGRPPARRLKATTSGGSRSGRVAPDRTGPVAEALEERYGAGLRPPTQSPRGRAGAGRTSLAKVFPTSGNGWRLTGDSSGQSRADDCRQPSSCTVVPFGFPPVHGAAPTPRCDARDAFSAERSSVIEAFAPRRSTDWAAATPASKAVGSQRPTARAVAEAVRFAGGDGDDATALPSDGAADSEPMSPRGASGAPRVHSGAPRSASGAPRSASGLPSAQGGSKEGSQDAATASAGRDYSGQPSIGAAGDGFPAPDRTATGNLGERTYSAAPPSMGGTNVAMIVMTAAEFDEFVADLPNMQRQMLRLQYRTRIIVNHNLFNQIFMFFIFINTVLLAMEYNNQPDSLTYFLTVANYVLTGLFTSEMIAKLIGLGFWDYIRDGFNIFDALVVAISLIEIVLSTVGGLNAARALRVLKALRVLRLFKLFRYMQSLRRIGEVLLSAFMSFAAIATLLMLFWFVFSIIGMHVFGVMDLDTYPWPNFSTFLYSLIATWNVLNLENWQNIMYSVVRVTNYGSSMFFVLWIVIGRYIFLTLFLAVTLEAFEAKYDPNAVRLGANKGGFASAFGSFLSGASSRFSRQASSIASSFRSNRSSGRDSPLDRSYHGKGGGRKGQGGAATEPGSKAAGLGHPGPGGMAIDQSAATPALRPGIGYLEDAQAAAAAQYGDPDGSTGPRVQIKNMYSIKQWIDTGNMGVLAADAADPSPGRWVDGSSRGQIVAVDTLSRGESDIPPPRAIISTDEASAAARSARGGVTCINDSAAESRASSAEIALQGGAVAAPVADAGGGGAARRASGGGDGRGGEGGNRRGSDGGDGGNGAGRRPLGEGVEPSGIIQADSTLLAPQMPLPAHHHRAISTTAGQNSDGRPFTAGAARRLSSGPPLQSLSRAVRRELEGGGPSEDEGQSEVDDIVAGGSAGGHATSSGGSQVAASSWARPTASGHSSPNYSSRVDSGELILSRTHGRSRMMRSNTSIDQSALRVALGTGRGAAQQGHPSDNGIQAKALRAHGAPTNFLSQPTAPQGSGDRGMESGAGEQGEDGAMPRQAREADRVVAPAAPAAAPAATAVRVSPAASSDAPATPAVGHRASVDMLGSFMGSGGTAHVAARSSLEAARPSDSDVIMATFQDMLHKQRPPGEPCPGQPAPQPAGDGQGAEAEATPSAPDWSDSVRKNTSISLQPRRHQLSIGQLDAVGEDEVEARAAAAAELRDQRTWADGEGRSLMDLAEELDKVLVAQRRVNESWSPNGRVDAMTAGAPMRAGSSVVAPESASGQTAPRILMIPDPRAAPSDLSASAADPERGDASLPADIPARPVAAARGGSARAGGPGGGAALADGAGPARASDATCQSLQDSAHSMDEVGLSAARLRSPEVPRAAGRLGIASSPALGDRAGQSRTPQPRQDPPLRRTSSGGLVATDNNGNDFSVFGDMLGEHMRVNAPQGQARDDSEEDLILGLNPGGSRRRSVGGMGKQVPPLVIPGEEADGGSAGDRRARDQGDVVAVVTKAGLPAEDGAADAGRRGDKGPPLRRISEAGSTATLDRADSFDSRASGNSHGSAGSAEGEDDDRKRKRRFRKRRRASILIEGTGKTFWIWDEDHRAREWAYWFVTHKRFDYSMFALILANCVMMALENPYVVPGSPMDKALYWSNVGFTALFTIEAIAKIFAFTFVAYIKRITNQVDFLIVVTSVLEIVLMAVTSSVEAVSALRVLRAIKPLRLLTRSAGMRLVFKSVTMSLMSMANVSVVCILFFLIFAILGVQLFSGRFYRCNDDSVAGQVQCVGTFTDPLSNTTLERTWSNDFPNFDNTGNALLCCFITATLNGYTEIMINAMSAPLEPGAQPHMFDNPGAFFWFFGFIVVCAFTLLNLYVGVIFSQFSKIRMLSETGSAFLTSDQNEWAELTKMVFRLKPPDKAQLPTGRVRRFCFVMVHNKSFDIFILTIILINVGFLAASWYNEPEAYTRQKDRANIVFMGFFAAEAAAKIFALGWVAYFKVAWNKLDFTLLVLGVLDLILSMLQSNFLRILRIFRIQKLITLVRVAHFAQLVKSVKGIQSLFSTLVYSLPAFGNVGALIGLFFFMYAYVGVFLFGKVQAGNSLDRHVNFHNFFQAVLVLMRVATGDNWTGIMFDCMVQPPECVRSSGHCGSYLSIPYFLTFVLLISVILLNLFTAVIIETFEKTHEQEEWKLSPQALEDFVTLWSEYDDGSGTIMPRHLEELLLRLDPPLGLGPYADSKDVLRFVYDLDIPLINARVPFHKTAFELVKRCSQAIMPDGAIKEQIDRLVDKFFHELATQDEMLNFSVAITVMKVQRKWRSRMRAAKLNRKKLWRQDRWDAPSYSEIFSSKGVIAEKFEGHREVLREGAKAWEIAQQSYNKKPEKAEVVRRMEPRWRFNAKYAPTSLVAATSEKTGLLALGKRGINVNVNKIVGLLRGGLLGGGGTTPSGDAGGWMQGARSPAGTTSGEQVTAWAAPNNNAEQTPSSPIPRLFRAITNGPRPSHSGGGALSPTGQDTSVGGRRLMGGVGGATMGGGGGGEDVRDGARMPLRSLSLSPTPARRATGTYNGDAGGAPLGGVF